MYMVDLMYLIPSVVIKLGIRNQFSSIYTAVSREVTANSIMENPNLPELCGHADSNWWGRFGITHLSHIVTGNHFVSFETLEGGHGIDNK